MSLSSRIRLTFPVYRTVAACSLFPQWRPVSTYPLFRVSKTAVGRSDVVPLRPHELFPYTRCFHAAASSELLVVVPNMGDSITEGTISEWKSTVGSYVREGDVIAVIDTDKVSVDVNASASGRLVAIKADAGDVVEVGKPLYLLDTAAVDDIPNVAQPTIELSSEGSPSCRAPAILNAPVKTEPLVQGKLTKPIEPPETNPISTVHLSAGSVARASDRSERRVPMSRIRMRIAERLKDAQNTAAMLTTFNECDMGGLMALRSELNDQFVHKFGVKMGFVSAFMMASSMSLKRFPEINAYIDGNEIVYRSYVDISVAVATPTGLMVPVVRDCDRHSWVELEQEIVALATKAKRGQIALEDLVGGTFTISNGGIYGSMLGTPIINPPQSSILGMHAVTKRPVVRDNQIVIRPIMYLALTYDHRLVDGREAVQFLCNIRDYIEDPRRMFLGL